MGFLIGFPLFIAGPCAIAAWIGTRLHSPVIAFVVTWVLTPFLAAAITILGIPILRAITPAENDGTIAIMLPFLGIVTGFFAGIVASIIVSRRRSHPVQQPLDSNMEAGDSEAS